MRVVVIVVLMYLLTFVWCVVDFLMCLHCVVSCGGLIVGFGCWALVFQRCGILFCLCLTCKRCVGWLCGFHACMCYIVLMCSQCGDCICELGGWVGIVCVCVWLSLANVTVVVCVNLQTLLRGCVVCVCEIAVVWFLRWVEV